MRISTKSELFDPTTSYMIMKDKLDQRRFPYVFVLNKKNEMTKIDLGIFGRGHIIAEFISILLKYLENKRTFKRKTLLLEKDNQLMNLDMDLNDLPDKFNEYITQTYKEKPKINSLVHIFLPV